MSGTLWILGGEEGVAAAVEEAAAERRESGAAGGDAGAIEPRVPQRASDLTVRPEPGDAVVDLGLPAVEWDQALEAREAERATRLGPLIDPEIPWVRMSLLGAAPDANSVLPRAQAAAEAALSGRDSAVILRVGILLGDCGLSAGFRAAVERGWVIPVPGIERARFEPLALADFARFCVQASESASRLDDRYDLGCGEILSGDLFVAEIAENLGLSRWRIPVPGFLIPWMAPLLARPNCPAAAVRIWLDSLRGGLLPRRMTPRDHFDVPVTSLRQAMADSVGMLLPPRRTAQQGKFTNWQAPKKKGILWSQRKPPRR